jgi:hypothetical protein
VGDRRAIRGIDETSIESTSIDPMSAEWISLKEI